jgi:hypothetical protein
LTDAADKNFRNQMPLRIPQTFIALLISVATPLFAQIPILSFPTSEGKFGYFENGPSDSQNFSGIAPGQTRVVYDAVFGGATARNPSNGYNLSDSSLVPWSTPAFYGGYRLTTTNNSDGDYLPNFVRGVFSPESGAGYASLPVTQIFASGSAGTLTNTVAGAFVTPTSIGNSGVFDVAMRGTSLGGAAAMLRGVAYDGTRWLVTADFAAIPSIGALSASILTATGWRELNIVDFSVSAEPASPAGTLTHSGIWFQATETSLVSAAGFDFTFSNATFTAIPEPGVTGLFAGVACLFVSVVVTRRRSKNSVQHS